MTRDLAQPMLIFVLLLSNALLLVSVLFVGKNEVKEDEKLQWIIDITIAYPKGEPLDLPTIVTGSRPPCKTYLFYRRYALSEVI